MDDTMDTTIDKSIARTIAFTGHRPQSLVGQEDQVKEALARLIRGAMEHGYETYITGMAIGVDQWAAEAVLQTRDERDDPTADIKLICAVPFIGQTRKWGEKSYDKWIAIAKAAYKIYVVSLKRTVTWQELDELERAAVDLPYKEAVGWLHARNHYMVNEAGSILGIWNGEPKGGTFNCLKYARKKKRTIVVYNPNTKKTTREP